MPWDEAYRLAVELAKDPSSRVCAAINEWSGPFSTEAFLLADLYDLTMVSTPRRGKPRPHPRPSDPKPKRMGRLTRPQHDVRAALAARGH